MPPRQLERQIPRDLETIVLKALAKDPGDRFATAEEMADELRLFVENRPIRSRPIPALPAVLAVVQAEPRAGRGEHHRGGPDDVLAIVSTVAAWTYREQRTDRAGLTRIASGRVRETTPEQLFEALRPGPARRFSRRVGQRFDSLDALEQAARSAAS